MHRRGGHLGRIWKITPFWLPDDNLTGLNGFLDPPNHSVGTKITILRRTMTGLLCNSKAQAAILDAILKITPFWLPDDILPLPPGGGGGTSICMCILGMCRARDPHFQPWISVPEHIIFTNYQTIRSGASQFYISWRILPFQRASFSKFSLISTRSSPPTTGSARTQSVRQRRGLAAVPEPRIFTLKTAQARSGAPHF